MQPLWESVKRGPSRESGELDTDFALNYHRALYSAQYDNAEDIWAQRWRLEDKAWRIEDGNWRETYTDTPLSLFTMLDKAENKTISYAPKDRKYTLSLLGTQSEAKARSLAALFGNLVLGKEGGTDATDLYGVWKDDRGNLRKSALIYTQYHIAGQGFVPIASRFLDPNVSANSAWQPESVPAVKAQPWAANYRDKNIADNPTHPTIPDLLIGPHTIVERRRTKYLALSPLRGDYLDVHPGVVAVVEGEAVGGDSLQALLSQASRGGEGAALHWAPGSGSGRNTTALPPVNASSASAWGEAFFASPAAVPPPPQQQQQQQGFITFPRAFDTNVDWQDRHWQYLLAPNDRWSDFRNFRDRQEGASGAACPSLHHLMLINFGRCARLEYDLTYKSQRAPDRALEPWALGTSLSQMHSPPQKDYQDKQRAFFGSVETADFEDCLGAHAQLLQRYEDCLLARVPDFNANVALGVLGRECVGGGGQCGPPHFTGPFTQALPNATYGFPAFDAGAAANLSGLSAYEPDITGIQPLFPDPSQGADYAPQRLRSYYGMAIKLTGRGAPGGWQAGSQYGAAGPGPFPQFNAERRLEGAAGGGEAPPPPAGRDEDLEAAAAAGSSSEPLSPQEEALHKAWREKKLRGA